MSRAFVDRRRIMPRSAIKSHFGIELLPCPFCFSLDIGIYISHEPQVMCCSCGAEGPSVTPFRMDNEEKQYKNVLAWNNRTKPVQPELKSLPKRGKFHG